MIICSAKKYRYFLSTDGGNNYVELKLVKNPSIKLSKQKGSYDFRASCGEVKFVYYENPGIYSSMVSRVQNYSAQTHKIKFKIELWENYTALTSTPYDGYVPLAAIKVNEDTGTISFTPTEDNKYEWYEAHKSDKHDFINSDLPLNRMNTLVYDVITTTEEYYIPDDITHSAPHGFSTSCSGITLQAWNIGNNYTGGYYQWENWVRHTGNNGSKAYYCYSDHEATADTEPGVGVNWADYWEEYNLSKYVARQIADLPLTAGGHDYLHGNGVFEEGFPAVITPDTGATNCDPFYYYYPTCSPESGTMNLVTDGSVYVEDAINHMLTGSGLAFYSQFFSDATNPVTGITNKLNHLYMVHKAFIKKIEDSSSKGEVSLQDYIADLCETFECFWFIDETNSYFRIEHQMYFENGFNYTGSQAIGIDLTDIVTYPVKVNTVYDGSGGIDDRQYDFIGDEIPEKETFAVLDSFDYDNFIQYDSAFTKTGEIKKHQINTFSTDFGYVIKYRAKTADDGYCLIACDAAKKILNRDAEMRFINYRGGQVFLSYPNGDLMWNNILNDFWIYYRHFTTGTINYIPKTFTTKRIKKQRPVNFPRLASFDPYELIKTNLGNGQISTAEIDTDTDFIKATLLY